MRSIWIVTVFGLVAFGCSNSSSSKSGGSSDPFAGTWDCTGTQTLNFTYEAGNTSSSTSNTAETVTITDNGDGTQTSTFTTDAGVTCARKASWSGDTTSLETGQTCTFGGLTFTYTSGGSTLSGTSFSSTGAFSLSGTITYTPDGGTSPVTLGVTGTGSSQSTCTKM